MSRGKTRRKFTPEFKAEAVALSRQAGMTVAKAASDLGLSEGSLHRWRAEIDQHGGEAFPGNGRLRPAEEELARLRRENVQLRMERDILKKATAFFANHPG
jgi:transposase